MMTDGGKGAFATTLTAAIRASGLTLDSIRLELAEHDVRISVATLSYWQNGRSQPAGAHAVRTLTAMEQVLGVPVRIGTPRGLGGLTDVINGPEWACVAGLLLVGRGGAASPKGRPAAPAGLLSKLKNSLGKMFTPASAI